MSAPFCCSRVAKLATRWTLSTGATATLPAVQRRGVHLCSLDALIAGLKWARRSSLSTRYSATNGICCPRGHKRRGSRQYVLLQTYVSRSVVVFLSSLLQVQKYLEMYKKQPSSQTLEETYLRSRQPPPKQWLKTHTLLMRVMVSADGVRVCALPVGASVCACRSFASSVTICPCFFCLSLCGFPSLRQALPYQLLLAVPADETYKQLDESLQGIWYYCCGHMRCAQAPR